MKRIHNFGAGPARLPDEVVKEIQEEFYSYKGHGYSICEVGHRTAEFGDVYRAVIDDFRNVMAVPDRYRVVFISAGASINYAMMPLNFSPHQNAWYVNTGVWSKKAIAEAQKSIRVQVAASSEETGFDRIPDVSGIVPGENVDYIHITTNNTIYGTQFHQMPTFGDTVLFADMTSDIASKEVDVSKFGLLYAGAQKNLGISGLSVAIIDPELIERIPSTIPTLLSYDTYIKHDSMFNTPNTFGIYVVGKMIRWIQKKGGVKAMGAINRKKAEKIYGIVDRSALYKNNIQAASRSLMNITFFMDTPETERRFIADAEKNDLFFLKGHKAVGGIRVSLYNATEMHSVDTLADFMTHFEKKLG